MDRVRREGSLRPLRTPATAAHGPPPGGPSPRTRRSCARSGLSRSAPLSPTRPTGIVRDPTRRVAGPHAHLIARASIRATAHRPCSSIYGDAVAASFINITTSTLRASEARVEDPPSCSSSTGVRAFSFVHIRASTSRWGGTRAPGSCHESPWGVPAMPGMRLELIRGFPRGILSPLRLPFRHPGDASCRER